MKTISKNMKQGTAIRITIGGSRQLTRTIQSTEIDHRGQIIAINTRGMFDDHSKEEKFLIIQEPGGLCSLAPLERDEDRRGGHPIRLHCIIPTPGMILDNNEFVHWMRWARPTQLTTVRNSRYQKVTVYENIHRGEDGPCHVIIEITKDYHAIIDPYGDFPDGYDLYAYHEDHQDPTDYFRESDYNPVVKANGQIVSEFEL